MKDVMKIVILTVTGLVIAIVVYPFVHESGHALATFISGGKVKEFSLFPLPNILCDVSGVSKVGLTVIGLSGIMLPFLFSVILYPNKFVAWYCVIIFKGIVMLSFVVSYISILYNYYGITDSQDDIIKVLSYWKNGEIILIPFLLISELIITISIIWDQPIKRISLCFKI